MPEKVPIRIIKHSPNKYDPLYQFFYAAIKFLFPKKTSIAILNSLIISGLFCFSIYAFATYSPGDTLDPACSPLNSDGSINSSCTVTAPILKSSLSSTATGLTYNNTTGVFSLTSGYVIPATTDQTNWNTAYTNATQALGTGASPTFVGLSLGSGSITTTGTGTLGTVNFGSATGVSAVATNGILTLAGLKSAGNNENLTLDFETTANEVGINSGSGVTNLNLNSLNLNTTGTITSAAQFGYGRQYLYDWDAQVSKISLNSSADVNVGSAAVVAWIGDSWTDGNGYALTLASYLYSHYGNAGVGYITTNGNSGFGGNSVAINFTRTLGGPGWAYGGGAQNYGLTQDYSTSSTQNDSITFTSNATTIRIHYLQQSGGGTIGWAVSHHGGAAVNSGTVDTSVGCGLSQDGICILQVDTGLTPDSYDLVLTVTSTAKPVTIAGVEYNVDPSTAAVTGTYGARVNNLGRGGAMSDDFAHADPTWDTEMKSLNPNLVIITLGVNDLGQGHTATQHYNSMKTIVDRIKADLPLASILLLTQSNIAPGDTADNNFNGGSPSIYNNYNPYNIAAFAQQQKALAISEKIGFIDDSALLGSYVKEFERNVVATNNFGTNGYPNGSSYNSGTWSVSGNTGTFTLSGSNVHDPQDVTLHEYAKIYPDGNRTEAAFIGFISASTTHTITIDLTNPNNYGTVPSNGSGMTCDVANSSHISGVGQNIIANNLINYLMSGTQMNGWGLAQNTAYGNQALYNPLTYYGNSNYYGAYDTAFGNYALQLNTTGSGNSAFGTNSLQKNTSGNNNIALGYNSLNANTTGGNNVAIGVGAMKDATGDSNTAVGFNALQKTTAGGNSALGYFALNANTTGYDNVGVGYFALELNQTGKWNTAIGFGTLTNTSSDGNTALGFNGLNANTTGEYNVAVGTSALESNSEGMYNTAIGSVALQKNVFYYNTAIGYGAAQHVNGTYTGGNTAIGYTALNTDTVGGGNVAMGYGAGFYETGSNKLFIDNQNRTNEASGRVSALIYGIFDTEANALAGQTIAFNVSSASFGSDRISGTVNVPGKIKLFSSGDNAYFTSFTSGLQTANATYTLPLAMPAGDGYSLTSTTTGVLSWTNIISASDERFKDNVTPLGSVLDKIKNINGVYYNWNDLYRSINPSASTANQIGMIAQNVETQFPELISKDNQGYEYLDYQKFTAVLLEGIKELNAKVDAISGTMGDGTVSGVDLTNQFVKGIQNILAALGIKNDGNGSVKKIQMVSPNGTIYCTWIDDNGDWQKTEGQCDAVSSPIIQPTSGEDSLPADASPTDIITTTSLSTSNLIINPEPSSLPDLTETTSPSDGSITPEGN